ncbi:MAG: hypothetical protein JW893_01555 [Candidatus Omnitrophica bacterium]|nr:hypothetical protein [Candidatus Omnitrophota bacterium]
MKNQAFLMILLLIVSVSLQFGMARSGQYDEEARRTEREERQRQKTTGERINPVTNFAGGVKQVTVDTTAGFISDTRESDNDAPPVLSTLEGARQGTEKILDGAVKGTAKIATLGFGSVEDYEVIEPEQGTDEPTKIKIQIPGT